MIDNKLETLIAVCETGSFTKAAEQLSLTQPAVSQHIRQLEKELGARLFNRAEGSIKLTAQGEIALKYAKRIKTLYQNMLQSVSNEKKQITRLTIGITRTAESSLMPDVLARYSNLHPDMRITILSDGINNLYNKLKTYELDLAVIEGRISDSNFHSILLDTDSLILAVSPQNPLAGKQIVTINELKKEKLILRLPDSATRSMFVSTLESQGLSLDEFNVILEVDNIAMIKNLVKKDFGVTILAKSAFLSDMHKGKLAGLPVENLSMIREVNMVYHHDFEQVEALRDIARIYYEFVNPARKRDVQNPSR